MNEKNTKEPVKDEVLHKEIDLIQTCITRMADNSFKLKELYISLISIGLTVMISQESKLLMVSIFLIIVSGVFWGLDAFFLKMETLYRWKYEWVIKKRMVDETSYLYDLNPYNRNMWLDADVKCECLMHFVFTKILVSLYGIVIGIALILLVVSIH